MIAFAFLAAVWSLLCAVSSAGNPSSCASTTCTQLKGLLGSVITLPTDSQYAALREENWSQTAWQHPSCIAVPTSTADVALLVRVLSSNDVPFAIRSGGHDPNPLDSSINTGVLISMDKLSGVTYDAVTKLASLGPGARWEAVYTELDKYNLTVVGGRVMPVGVGGLILGSGLSYLSDLYGLVCDNVVNYEVVLGDGRVVNANSNNNPDLFWALKGGTNNFGIVTNFKVATYPIHQVWGGMQIFSVSQMPALMQALYEYQTTPNKDLYANMIINLIPTNGTLILTMVYLKPVERPAAYAPFYSLTPLFEQVGFMTLHQIMALFPPASLQRWTWYVHSLKPNSNLYADISTLFSTAPEVATIAGRQAGTLVAAIQPISANAVLAGRAKAGGNALGLQAVNQTWFSISAGWWNAADDGTIDAAVRSLHQKMGVLATSAGAKLDYLFMNDANINQSVIASYGTASVQRLRRVQQRYDPDLVFQKLVPGGHKIPAS